MRRSMAFSLMLEVKRCLTTGMITHRDHHFTMLESSEDAAAVVIERALRNAEKRGARWR